MITSIKIRCTSKKEVFYPEKACWVYEFFVLGAHDGGDPLFPNGQVMFTVLGAQSDYKLGEIYVMGIDKP